MNSYYTTVNIWVITTEEKVINDWLNNRINDSVYAHQMNRLFKIREKTKSWKLILR